MLLYSNRETLRLQPKPHGRTATDEAISNYYDPESKLSKYYDIRNRDPRMFQVIHCIYLYK